MKYDPVTINELAIFLLLLSASICIFQNIWHHFYFKNVVDENDHLPEIALCNIAPLTNILVIVAEINPKKMTNKHQYLICAKLDP